jgi:hypothetical protein
LTVLRNKTNNQKEILNVHNLDIKTQEDLTTLHLQNKDNSDIAENDATVERKTCNDGIVSLKASISRNKTLFEKRSAALKDHQLLVETDVIAALDRKLADTKKQKERAKDLHEKLKKEKAENEKEMKQKQERLQKQVKAQLDLIRDDCEATSNQFEQCLGMIERRNEQVYLRMLATLMYIYLN